MMIKKKKATGLPVALSIHANVFRLLYLLMVNRNVLVVPDSLELDIEAENPLAVDVGKEVPDKPLTPVLGHLRPACLGDNPTLFLIVGFLAPLVESESDNLVLTCGDMHFVLFHISCSFI